MASLLPLLLQLATAADSGITNLHVASDGCPDGTARIDSVSPWTGDFGGDDTGRGVYLCAGRGGTGGSITALRAVGAASAALVSCPAGFTPVSGASSGLSTRGFVGLCVSRNISLGPAINILTGVQSDQGAGKAPKGCPTGLTAVSGTDHRPALPKPNMTVCHGYSCTSSQQGELCPTGTPGASDRDFRCCDLKLLSGPKPGSPAPNCTGSAPPIGTANCNINANFLRIFY